MRDVPALYWAKRDTRALKETAQLTISRGSGHYPVLQYFFRRYV
jgi:hypothetical protein